jgi:hypothetical protein
LRILFLAGVKLDSESVFVFLRGHWMFKEIIEGFLHPPPAHDPTDRSWTSEACRSHGVCVNAVQSGWRNVRKKVEQRADCKGFSMSDLGEVLESIPFAWMNSACRSMFVKEFGSRGIWATRNSSNGVSNVTCVAHRYLHSRVSTLNATYPDLTSQYCGCVIHTTYYNHSVDSCHRLTLVDKTSCVFSTFLCSRGCNGYNTLIHLSSITSRVLLNTLLVQGGKQKCMHSNEDTAFVMHIEEAAS